MLKPPRGTLPKRKHPLTRGLVGAYLMNEGGGVSVMDSSGHNRKGTLTGGYSWIYSPWGPALRLNYGGGSDDYFSVRDIYNNANAGTIVQLICPTFTPPNDSNPYMSYTGGGSTARLYLGLVYSGAGGHFVMRFGSDANQPGATQYTVGQWYCFATTFNKLGLCCLYVDGVLDGSYTHSAGNIGNTGYENIGSYTGLSYAAQADYALTYCYDRALSADEIRQFSLLDPFPIYRRERIELWSPASAGPTMHEAAGAITGLSALTGNARLRNVFAQGTLTGTSSVSGTGKMHFVYADGAVSMTASSSVTGNLILAASTPTGVGGYDFAADPHCLSLYDGETWPTYLEDQKGTDDWQCYPRVNTTDYREGNGGIEFSAITRPSGIDWADDDLVAGWPGKAGTGSQTVSVTFWFKAHQMPTGLYFYTLVGKGRTTTQGWCIHVYQNKLYFDVGDTTLTDWRGPTNTLSANVWYHVGITFDNSDKSYRIRVYDTSIAGNWTDKTGTMPHNMVLGGADFSVGYGYIRSDAALGYQFDGLLDDLGVFSDVLSAAEIDQCRAGTYDYGTDGNCKAHWSFDTANFLMEDKNNLAVHEISVPTLDFNVYKTGSASFSFNGTDHECGYRLDTNLSAGTPYKAGTTNLEWGCCFWVRFRSTDTNQWLVTKYLNNAAGSAGIGLVGGASPHLRLCVRYAASSDEYYEHTTDIGINVWYHVTVNVSAAANTYSINVWDDDLGAAVEVSGALLHDPLVSTQPWKFGAAQLSTSTSGLDGWLDEIAQFDAPITAPKIVEIRAEGVTWAQSSLSGQLSQTYNAAGTLQGVSSISLSGLQVKQHYVPAGIVEEPFPVPMLWDYENIAPDFPAAVREWAPRMSQYVEEHLRRVTREVTRLGTAKESGWVDVT